MKILSFLFFLCHTVVTWRHPTDGFSARSRNLIGCIFYDVDELLEAVIELLNEIQL
jgi:hypothetical protein